MKKLNVNEEICPICGYYNKDFLLNDEDYFYLCHRCGGFYRRFSDGRSPVIGITFDPKTIPLKRQLKAIRKHYKILQGMEVMNHREYKIPKKEYDEKIYHNRVKEDSNTIKEYNLSEYEESMADKWEDVEFPNDLRF